MSAHPLPPSASLRSGAIVLVHGAWVGEWSWLPVLSDLQASGRPVHLVSLTGHGARRHQSGNHVRLHDHVADVIFMIETLDLTDITLVGHSYGGRVITQAAIRLADRLASLVYLDAHTPVARDPGQPPERVAIAAANGGMVPFAEIYLPDAAMIGEEGVAWFLARLMPQSFTCLTDDWVGPLPTQVRKTFVFASSDESSRFAEYADICRSDPDWAYHELDGHHFLMFSHPTEVAEIILQA